MALDRRVVMAAAAAVAVACSRSALANAEPKPQPRRVLANLYQCEGCEGALERNPGQLDWRSQMSTPTEPGAPFVFEGVVYQTDGKTPAPDVVLYAYQTNADGLYANGSPDTVWSRRHGRLRGWIKTGADGRYQFSSIKPAPYPNDTLPAHVHITVKEPGRPPYWIDDIVFDGEFGVTAQYRKAMVNKGGDGIVKLSRATDGVWRVRRDILLERHT